MSVYYFHKVGRVWFNKLLEFQVSTFGLKSPETQMGELNLSSLIRTSVFVTSDSNYKLSILRGHLDLCFLLCVGKIFVKLLNSRPSLITLWILGALMTKKVLFCTKCLLCAETPQWPETLLNSYSWWQDALLWLIQYWEFEHMLKFRLVIHGWMKKSSLKHRCSLQLKFCIIDLDLQFYKSLAPCYFVQVCR